jgi:hypothetical protein
VFQFHLNSFFLCCYAKCYHGFQISYVVWHEVLERMVDPYVLLGMMALFPLLEAVNTLIEFAQRRNIFICDFVAALGKCHSQLFTYYMNQETR